MSGVRAPRALFEGLFPYPGVPNLQSVLRVSELMRWMPPPDGIAMCPMQTVPHCAHHACGCCPSLCHAQVQRLPTPSNLRAMSNSQSASSIRNRLHDPDGQIRLRTNTAHIASVEPSAYLYHSARIADHRPRLHHIDQMIPTALGR